MLKEPFDIFKACMQSKTDLKHCCPAVGFKSGAACTLKPLEKLVQYKFEVDVEKDLEKKADDFFVKLRIIADSLYNAECNVEAFAVYILAIIARLDYMPQKKIFDMHGAYFEGNMDEFFAEFRRVIHSRITEKMVDTVMEIWNRIHSLASSLDSFARFEKEIQWFLDTYKYQNIEFKR